MGSLLSVAVMLTEKNREEARLPDLSLPRKLQCAGRGCGCLINVWQAFTWPVVERTRQAYPPLEMSWLNGTAYCRKCRFLGMRRFNGEWEFYSRWLKREWLQNPDRF